MDLLFFLYDKKTTGLAVVFILDKNIFIF